MAKKQVENTKFTASPVIRIFFSFSNKVWHIMKTKIKTCAMLKCPLSTVEVADMMALIKEIAI